MSIGEESIQKDIDRAISILEKASIKAELIEDYYTCGLLDGFVAGLRHFGGPIEKDNEN